VRVTTRLPVVLRRRGFILHPYTKEANTNLPVNEVRFKDIVTPENTLQLYPSYWAVSWLRRLVAGLPLRRSGFDPGSVPVGILVDKVPLGQVSLRVVGFPLSISFHWCSITCKTWQKTVHLHHKVAQKALRLWCVRSICCGALHHVKKKDWISSSLQGKYSDILAPVIWFTLY
jgi:hypothetical protein